MTLLEIKDWLKKLVDSPQWYINNLDATKEKAIVIYPSSPLKERRTIGGEETNSYKTKAISVIVHWGKNANEAEIKAYEVFDKIFSQSHAIIGGKSVVFFDKRQKTEPISLGKDDKKVYEYVIEVVIYYQKG